MQDPLRDQTVLVAIILTILIVFSIIFSVRPQQNGLQPEMEWKETPAQGAELLRL